MRFNVLSLAIAGALNTVVAATDAPTRLDNANHLFNAIHSSMRQWGSSWHHNGMSFFLATVPTSTQLYHGTGTPDTVIGTEWLAFEPEHALVFAHTWDKPSKNESSYPSPPSPPLAQEPLILHGDDPRDKNPSNPPPSRPGQPLPPPPPGQWKPGYLHTYTTLHPLSLLYIDGQSAGKSLLGTLDSQDIILLNQSSTDLGPGGGERERAAKLCEQVHSKWSDKIHGVLRMEAGFEIILCEFEKHLALTDVIRAGRSMKEGRGMDTWPWYKAISARYNGIGGERVTLNYNEFFSAFSYGLDLFWDNAGQLPSPLPRLENVSVSDLNVMRRDVDDLIFRQAGSEIQGVNWQAKADMIVTRYSNLLLQLLTMRNATMLQNQIIGSFRPFINTEDRNLTAEIERCTHQFLPYPASVTTTINGSLPLAYQSLLTVSARICSVLFSLIPPPSSSSPSTPPPVYPSSEQTTSLSFAHSTIQSLIKYLDWSVFADCPEKCTVDEICFIPIWPMGSKKQRELGHGTCMSAEYSKWEGDYWHDGRRPGGPGSGHGPGAHDS